MSKTVGAASALAILVIAAIGCDSILGKEVRPGFCASNPGDSDCPRDAAVDALDAIDADTGCSSNSQCLDPGAMVCDVSGSRACVQCLMPDQTSACAGATPVCMGTTCRKCTQHAQCTMSNVCLPDGSCADQSLVAYVDPMLGSDNPTCAKSTPCAKIAKGIATSKLYVKLHGSADESVSIDIPGKVTLLGDPGAKLTRTSNGLLLEIRGSSQVEIYDMEISGASGMNNPGISMPTGNTASLALTRATVANNQGGGIIASGGSVTVTQSAINNNPGGGISISAAQFDITNCFIVGNGGASSGLGGVDIAQILTVGGTHRLDFNTIAANLGPLTVPENTGVNCTTIGTALVFNSNIIYGNAVNGGGQQLGGSTMCSASYSDVGPDAAPGATNINMLPMFVGPADGNFHLMSNSPAKDVADPSATLPVDFDGDTRPQGTRRDMGADEVRQ